MRIYEFAKKHNLSSEDLIEALNKAGYKVGSHLFMLTNQEMGYLKKKYKGPQKNNPSIKKSSGQSSYRNRTDSNNAPQGDPVNAASKPVAAVSEILLSPMTPSDFAQTLGILANDVILTLLRWGILAPKNLLLDENVIRRLAEYYEVSVKAPEATSDQKTEIENSEVADIKSRPPIIVILGHVDHGKTTLLDYIRKSRVASREKGGITQHLGAYHVDTKHGGIVFLDTPGHEAFTKIRSRGVKTADIAVLIIAADDGIMPQTIEAIKFAKQMDVPIIVAVNKIDKADPIRLEVIKRQLSEHDLLPEDWGGQVIVAPISAKTGQGVDELLELIDLQAQVMELKTDFAGEAKGYVLESKIEKGRGSVATIMLQQGILHLGDYFVSGNVSGRVSSITDSYGKQLKEAGPANPVRVAGFSSLPNSGNFFEVVSKKSARRARPEEDRSRVLLKEKAINLIVKTDTNSSKEALLDSIKKISKKIKHIDFSIVSSGVGEINESDVALAANTKSAIVGLHVKAEQNALQLAKKDAVSIVLFDIIYKLLEDLQERAEQQKEVVMVDKKIGEGSILKVFDIKKLGIVAGCMVKDGVFSRNGKVVVWRGKQKIGQGQIISLQREGKNVKEVHAGFDCAFRVEGLDDFYEDDRVECFISVPEGKA
ncbi:MAG: translation initiation factor IF-2 [Candidatus Dependentiae bacterium]